MRFDQHYDRRDFLDFLKDFLPEDFVSKEEDILIKKDRHKEIRKSEVLGFCESLNLYVLEMSHARENDPRISIATDAFKILADHWIHNALVIFKSNNSHNYRLSFLTINLDLNEKNKVVKKYSNAKRHSFYLGPDAKVNTPTRYLITRGCVSSYDDLRERFSLEVVNKEFYKEISNNFIKLVGGTLDASKGGKTYEATLKLPSLADQSQASLEFAVRLIGRIIFCWFLREKKSQAGVALMPKELLSLDAIEKHQSYYHNVLEPIFFEVLNKPIKVREEQFLDKEYSLVPYLNGGLFSPHEDDYYKRRNKEKTLFNDSLVIPDQWFKNFFEILETYNFTIDENTSFDEELSIDPEMLGRIFENLLAEIDPETGESARKSTGSFYTPRAIVDFMVDESLFAYLKNKTKIEDRKIRAIISYDLGDDLSDPLSEEEKHQIVVHLSDIKVLDPACGSGAFPIGILQKIVFILQQVDPNGQDWFKRQIKTTSLDLKRVIEREFANKNFDYIRKLGVIRENIFGVDIQPIATEISRLRCFLTLIVDESIHDNLENRGIEPLPNLDFKFVTANSLIGLPNPSGPNQEGLFEDRSGIAELQELRDMFFTASGFERDQLRLQFVQAQNRIFQRLIDGRTTTVAQLTARLSSWDPFSHKGSSWFDPEWMFGIKEGFDVVIANPPYFIYQGHNKDEIPLLRSIPTYEIAGGGKLNAFKLFLARGQQLLTRNGILAFIFQNSFLADNSVKKLRQFYLQKQTILSIDSFPERDNPKKRVFEAVKMSVCIMISMNQLNPGYNFPLRVWKDRNKTEGWRTTFSNTELNDYDPIATPIPYLRESEKEIFKNCFSNRTSQKIRCYEGELNMTFHKHYFSKDSKNPKVIKGAQVLRYLLTDKMSQGEIDYLDETLYLKENNADKSKHHNLERIVMQGITGVNDQHRVIATLLPSGFYCANSCNYIISAPSGYTLRSILGILNSNLINWLFKKTSTNSNVNTYEMANIPIPLINNSKAIVVKNIDKLVDQVISQKITPGSVLVGLEKEINGLVYDLYGLTDEEIKIVEMK